MTHQQNDTARDRFEVKIQDHKIWFSIEDPLSPEEVAFKHRIDEISTVHPYYGYRRIAAQLHREGRSINQKTVARSMQEMG